jgi:hypothetical protein
MSLTLEKRPPCPQIAWVFVGLGLFTVVSAGVSFFLSGFDSSWHAVFGTLFLMWGLVLTGASSVKSDSSHEPAKVISISPSRFPDLFTPPDDREL